MLTLFLHWGGAALGLWVVAATWRSIIVTIILPRRITSSLTFWVWAVMHGLYRALADRQRLHADKDRLLALLGPVTLLAVLAAWMAAFVLGYALLLWPLIPGGLGAALGVAGSSFLTLGVSAAPPGPATLLEYAAAATGMIVVALQIGYLPTIYGAYNRRETLVLALRGRAGSPIWGPQVLLAHQRYGMNPTLPALFAAWETWAADITESHASYPWLMVFRSSEPGQSWVLSLLAVLDAAALLVALAPASAPAETRPCLRAGTLALRTLAGEAGPPRRYFGPVDEMHPPDTSVSLPHAEFLDAVARLQAEGFVVEESPEEAWRQFRFWRAQYEEAASVLAAFVVAPAAPWSGDGRG